jgi:hypothetical protein
MTITEGIAEGEALKEQGLAVAGSRYALALATKLAFLQALLDAPGHIATTDATEENLSAKFPHGGKWRGNAINQLCKEGLIEVVNAERSIRPARHRGLLLRWRLVNIAGAVTMIAKLRRLLAVYGDTGPDAAGSPILQPFQSNNGTGPAVRQPSLF